MSSTNFDKALEFTLRWEGGYVNDPVDPGGETNRGITDKRDGKVDGKADVDGDGQGDISIKNLTKEHAADIYRRNYWDVFGCDAKSFADAVAIFDTAVNCGVARTAIWLDGCKTWQDLLECRRLHYERLAKNPKLKKFKKGWMNRLSALIEYIHKTESHTKQ